jgi:hypothetical protein
LGILTHYSFYIFYISSLLWAFIVLGSKRKLFLLLCVPALVGLLVLFIYSRNPLFIRSLSNQELGGVGTSPIKKILDIKNVERVKEVITNYYLYGLYYYRLDYWAQYFLKKSVFILFVIGIITTILNKNIKLRKVGIFSITVLTVSLVASLVGEKLGYYPFGGRHIMPFSFLVYIILSLSFSWIYSKKIMGRLCSVILLLILVMSFVSFQFCSQTFRYRYPGVDDPQGDIYSYCSQQYFSN